MYTLDLPFIVMCTESVTAVQHSVTNEVNQLNPLVRTHSIAMAACRAALHPPYALPDAGLRSAVSYAPYAMRDPICVKTSLLAPRQHLCLRVGVLDCRVPNQLLSATKGRRKLCSGEAG